MCDQMPPKGSRDTAADMPRPITVEDLHRMASSYWRLRDPVLMASAWDKPPTPGVQPARMSPRSFGQLPSLSVPETFDDPLPDPESGAWEGDLPP